MPNERERIEAEAIGWVIRLRDGAAADWEGFAAWLEADPAHAAAYDEFAMVDAEAGAIPGRTAAPLPLAARPGGERRIGRRAMLGWGIAASVAGLIGYGTLRSGEDTYAVVTAPGEHRSIDLADGGRVDLNGATRLTLSRDRPRFARLEGGEALFTVVHDAAHPFRVEVGDAVLEDLGTVFNVVRQPQGTLEVAVTEGAVRYAAGSERAELRPGMILRKEAGRPPLIGRSSAEAITGWREGRLSYFNETVGEIAADLARNTGLPVAASARASTQRFSGVIVLDRDPDRLFARVSALLEVDARRAGDGWILTTGDGDTP